MPPEKSFLIQKFSNRLHRIDFNASPNISNSLFEAIAQLATRSNFYLKYLETR